MAHNSQTLDAKAIGIRIRTLRETRGWSREQLAEKADMSPASLAYLELGHRTPSLSVAVALAQSLSVDLLLLVVGDTPTGTRSTVVTTLLDRLNTLKPKQARLALSLIKATLDTIENDG